jgi:hypothetical protein
MHEVESDGTLHTFELDEEEHKRLYMVQFNSVTSTIYYSCKIFESMGWLCRHALRVFMNVRNITQIPAQYVLKQWTKDAKKGLDGSDGSVVVKDKSIVTLYLNSLVRMAYSIITEGAQTESTRKIAFQKLIEISELIEKEMKKLKLDDVRKKISEVLNDYLGDNNGNETIMNERQILNPSGVWPKGMNNTKKKNPQGDPSAKKCIKCPSLI